MLNTPTTNNRNNNAATSVMMVLSEQIYQYKKGVRRMVLYTLNKRWLQNAVEKLERQNISYTLQAAGNRNVNIYFGREECINVVRQIVTKPLSELSPEQDFILGTLLGYDVCMQCERYCQRAARTS